MAWKGSQVTPYPSVVPLFPTVHPISNREIHRSKWLRRSGSVADVCRRADLQWMASLALPTEVRIVDHHTGELPASRLRKSSSLQAYSVCLQILKPRCLLVAPISGPDVSAGEDAHPLE